MGARLKEKIRLGAYPEAEIVAALTAALIEGVRNEAVRSERSLPDDDDLLIATSAPIDSLSALETLCELDRFLPFKVGQGVVQAGGYESIQAALDHILPGVKREWVKRQEGKK